MKIKQLKEKTIKGFIDFLPKLSIEAIPGLQDKFNDIENTYLPLSGGRLTGVLNIDFTEGIQIIENDLSPRNTYIGNGSIKIE